MHSTFLIFMATVGMLQAHQEDIQTVRGALCAVSVFECTPPLSLQEFRAFEILRSSRHRVEYLLMKEAKIIALTCTHAALKEETWWTLPSSVNSLHLVIHPIPISRLSVHKCVWFFSHHDHVLMEEAALILEILRHSFLLCYR